MAPNTNGAARKERVVRWPKLRTLLFIAISPDGAAVAMKLFHAAIVAVGAIYVD